MRLFTSVIASPKFRAVLALGALSLALPSLSFAVSPVKLSGGITGLVRNGTGIPQMGATVLLFNREDRLSGKALTDENGAFGFLSLLPDVYSVRVTLRSFAPVFRNHIVVQPGVRSMLNVNLTTLFSSIELITPPAGHRDLMNDDWKWTLRTASSTRPVLRLLPKLDPNPIPPRSTQRASAVFSETRGLVKLSGGDGGQASGFANEADLGTSFAFATSLFGSNQVAFSGNLGYTSQSGMSSAGFHTSYTRNVGPVSPEVSVTMRQLFLPRVTDSLVGGPSDLPRLRTMSVNFGDEAPISDSLHLKYGFSLDSVSFLDRLHYFSPYARLDYSLPDSSKIQLSYTSGNARPDLAHRSAADTDLQQSLSALSRMPRVSVKNGRAKVQRGENIELGYTRTAGSRTYQVAGYREHVTNAALTIVAPNGLYAGGDILPDLFSSGSVFDSGSYQTLGYNASVTQALGDNFHVSLIYGSVGVLTPRSSDLVTDNPDELRSLIHAGRRHAVTTRTSATIPHSGTHFVASYQWMEQGSITPGHMYSTQTLRPEAGLNLYVRQPIPTFFSLPWRMEASADLRNLLAQGYVPLSCADGRRLLLVQTPRSFRGGLSFIF
ncbi:MAG: hypothetical protein DMG57_00275 [Acidobacteria bacterium]|nr:MAG: hypothetical protein DMG57_00275 [Acidobacteriota bacterium]